MLLTEGLHDIGHAAVLPVVHSLDLVDHDLFSMKMLGMFQKILFISGEINPFQILCYVGR